MTPLRFEKMFLKKARFKKSSRQRKPTFLVPFLVPLLIPLLIPLLAFSTIFFSGLLGCAGPTHRLGWSNEEGDLGPGVDSAAIEVDAFNFRKNMPIHPQRDLEFYFKNCSLTSDQTFYSKTSYWCNEP